MDGSSPAAWPFGRGGAVLVVEDDPDMLELLKRMIVRLGFEAMTAVNGKDALRELRSHPISLVITDLLMPEMDGIELIRCVCVERPGLPVIAMSSASDWETYLRAARHLGAAATLVKPVSREDLGTAIRQTLGSPA
jgi:DNA-binding NtrC family response regulator